MHYPDVVLRKHEERRVQQGHLWIFSNEIDTTKSPLSQYTPGQLIRVVSHNGHPVGVGYINPHSLICVRLLNHSVNKTIDESFFNERIGNALALRKRLFDQTYYRLVHGEGDYLPGLVVDLFNDTAVVQTSTMGMEQQLDVIVDAVTSTVAPQNILLINTASIRTLEQLPQYEKCVLGSTPDYLHIVENQCTFHAPTLGAQKTGWFYDHRANRLAMQKYVTDKTVLDVFSYTGGWGIQAAAHGAADVTCIDSSAKAHEWIALNAKLNKCENRIKSICDDAFNAMQALIEQHKSFDIVIVDPPAFIKRKKDIAAGTAAYQRLNQYALQLCAPEGILISASCSYHFDQHAHWQCLRKAAHKCRKHIQIIEQGYQSQDHPIHPSIAETQYISVLTARVMNL